MKAMILAAGLGTRLRPFTNNIPKALVEVDGIPILQHVILNLKKQGFDLIIINVHHFSNQIIDFINKHDFGVEILISDESDELLDTGGGIVKALPLIFKHDDSPVLVHNVDILSNADLKNLMLQSREPVSDVALLVSNRTSSRKLIINDDNILEGWHNLTSGEYRMLSENTSGSKESAFSGIYTMTRGAIEEMKNLMGEGKYSVMDYFLNKSREKKVIAVEQSGLKLLDIGKPATLSQAPDLLKELNNTIN